MSRPDLPKQLAPDAQAQADLVLMGEVVRAMLIRLGGEVVVTGDDLFVARQCGLQAAPLPGGGLGMRIVMPAIIPAGPKEFSIGG